MESKPEEFASLNFESDILPKILEARKKRKGYATFFDWPNKRTKERGIVCDLLKSIEDTEGYCEIKTVRANESDPPDCIGTTVDKKLVAFEVTELVDQKTVEMNRMGRQARKEWPPDKLLEKLKNIIRNKDSKTFHGGPYSKITLVIFTDEPEVRSADCDAILDGQILGQCRSITDCYLLLSYQPGRKFYPYFMLAVSR